jgi:hypothetical protein
MGDQSEIDQQLKQPQDVRGPDGTRADGRPTDHPDAVASRTPAEQAPTVPPEETGDHPTTEHAPGGDL